MTGKADLDRRAVLKMGVFALAVCGISFSAFPVTAVAQTPYPTKPVTLVVPWPAGGTSDVLARLIAHELGNVWEHPIIVDNRPGASGTIGTRHVVDADPDGYTLLFSIDSSQIVAGLLNPPAAYRPVDDFQPISLLARSPYILLAHPSLNVSTVQELVDYAKANPGKLSSGSAGIGTTSHLIVELFNQEAGVDLVHVPYPGAAASMVGQLAGEVQATFVSSSVATTELASGNSGQKALGAVSAARWPALPDVPTFAEQGFNVIDESMFGMMAPANTPQEIVKKINEDIRKSLDTPEMRERLIKLGYVLSLSAPDEYGEILIENTERKKKIIEAANIGGG